MEARLLDLWGESGYVEAIPPLLLPEEAAREATADGLWGRTLRFAANGDGAFALRSDFTASVAWAVVRSQASLDAPLRLCYAGPVVRGSEGGGRGQELWQAGCERVDGRACPGADAEVAALAAASLTDLGLEEAVLELGEWGLVGPLLDALGGPPEARAALELAVNRKSLPALEDLRTHFGETPEMRLLGRMIHLGGRPDALDALAPDLAAAGLLEAWERLRSLGADVAARFPRVAVRLEPTDVRRWSYYTGMTVKAFVPRCPVAVLSGGRYDGLYPALGRPSTACGFAVQLSPLLEV